MDAIRRLRELGQSAWLDYLDHRLVTSGELERWVAAGLGGLTSNPTIFEKTIRRSADYDDVIRRAKDDETDGAVLEDIVIREITAACDVLRPVYDETEGQDGFVSVEVAPSLAHDSTATVREARRLWQRVGRPNLMIKIPGTREGVAAVEQCLAAGLNVNVTLLFSVSRYEEVASAFLRALDTRRIAGLPIDRIASVASFFVSRVDTKVDQALGRAGASADMRGHTAIANAKLAYETFERVFDANAPRWAGLATKGGHVQRLLWASTSPKDPAYHDLYYVEALVGRDTVDTMTKETLHTLVDHGKLHATLTEGREEARRHMAKLSTFGIDLDALLRQLEDEGVAAFAKSYDGAVAVIAHKRRMPEPDFAEEAQPKETEFGDEKSAKAATGKGIERIP